MTPPIRLIAGLTLVLLAAVSARSEAPGPGESLPDGSAAEALVADAAGGPPEFGADLLIRIATSRAITETARKRELLETAFLRAYGAHESYKRVAPWALADSRTGGFSRAYATGLDALTLQIRATLGMMAIDPARAREMFEWIDFYLPPGTCGDALVPVADEYYAALAVIARRTFPGSVEGRDEALRFLELNLWRAHLPAELPAAARSVRAFQPRRDEAGYLETMVSALMEHGDRDPRSFSTFGLDITVKTGELGDEDRAMGVGGETLMRGLRKYLVANLSASRCIDSATEPPIVDAFNALVRRKEVPADIAAPIAARDALPAKMLGASPVAYYWQTADAWRLADGLTRLRDPVRVRGPRSDAIKRGSAWQAQAQDWLVDLELWNGTREPVDRDYFDQKSLLYGGFLDTGPPASLRARAVRSLVEFLRRSDKDRDRRALWFSHVRSLLDRDDPLILAALDQSGDFVLTLYARAQRLLDAQPRESPRAIPRRGRVF
jgi:hypothetical protein